MTTIAMETEIRDIFKELLEAPASRIIEGLWLGSIDNAEDTDFLTNEIDTVINVCERLHDVIVPDKTYRYFPLRCIPFYARKDEMEMALKAVKAVHEEHSRGRRVLVQCALGIDRSPTILLKFLSEHYDIKFWLAERMIREARPIAQPHVDWWRK